MSQIRVPRPFTHFAVPGGQVLMALTNSSHEHLPRGPGIFENILCTSLYSKEGGCPHDVPGQFGQKHDPTFLLQ